MKLVLSLVFTCAAFAQTLTLSGPANAKAGTTATITVALSNSVANTGPAAMQFSSVLPAGFAFSSPSLGAASTSSTKTIQCNAANLLCVVYGMNQNVIPNGNVATFGFQIPASATPGPVTISLSNLVAVNRTASVMPLGSGPNLTINIVSRADINADGKVVTADVSLMVTQVVSGATCSDDQNFDDRCDIVDIYVVVLRAMGL